MVPQSYYPDIQFQSTLPRRERRQDARAFILSLVISIHAPAKGATNLNIDAAVLEDDFNPRSREGSDEHGPQRYEGRSDFNPRSREGSDTVAG